MSLNIQNKKTIILKVRDIAIHALSIVIADVHGVKSNDMTKLRRLGRQEQVYIKIIRNTLMQRIVKNTNFECLKNHFIGSTLVAFSNKHPGMAARIFKKFAQDNNNFKIKLASFEGKILLGPEIDYLATLPTHTEAITQLTLIMKEASIGKFIRILIIISRSVI